MVDNSEWREEQHSLAFESTELIRKSRNEVVHRFTVLANFAQGNLILGSSVTISSSVVMPLGMVGHIPCTYSTL
jgi:hypothetical protein